MSTAVASSPQAVLLAGPTCAGKTALALELAARFPAEIVSVGSAQVYRGMDVGTSKPSPAVRAQVPHHVIDICDPADPYSAGRFRRDATDLIRAIREEFKEHEDLPNTTNPDDWAKVGGKKGEKIIHLRTISGGPAEHGQIETISTGHYL